VVRKRYCGTAVLGGALAQGVHAAGAVQERVFTVDVEMDELAHRTVFDLLI
jgi:hypothetical protein